MLYCTDCEQFFDEEEAKAERERIGEFWGEDAYKDYIVCPHCGSDQIEEARKCKLCDEWKPDDAHDCCEHCRDKVFDMYCLMLLTLETENPWATRNDVLNIMGDEFEHFWDVKL